MLRQYKYLGFLTAFFVTVLIVSNIASSKILALGPFTFDGGTILFPLSYIFGDVLTEVYGYSRSRRVIWTGFLMLLLTSVVFMIVGALPPASGWDGQMAYEKILGITPRIVLASVLAFFAGEFSNSYILAKMKVLMKGRRLWMRTIGSTLVGEGIDSVLFVAIAFWGVYPMDLLTEIVISNYIFKVGVEVLFTPVTYMVTAKLKKLEKEDYYDTNTDFNPFSLKGRFRG
jgi:uncharacterized integral membrane protein (TIGR00697 family)